MNGVKDITNKGTTKMNDEMREAFKEWWVEPIKNPLMGDQRVAFLAFQAAYQLQQKRIDELVEITDSLYDIRSLVKGAKYKGSLDHALMLIEQKINELKALTGTKS